MIIEKIKTLLRKSKLFFVLFREEMFWISRCVTYNWSDHSKDADLSSLLVICHVLEKGITMPNRRLGFGIDRVRQVLLLTKKCIERYGHEHDEIQFALGDLAEYIKIHEEANFELPRDIVNASKELNKFMTPKSNIHSFVFSKDEYFGNFNSFTEFAMSRHSCRHFSSEPIDIETINRCIKIAQTAPSACNRQSTRVYIISSYEAKNIVLKYQNGSRGFGQDADKFLLITAEQRAWDVKQQKSSLIDAGIFSMNLLYALHESKICACTLNAHIYYDQIKNFYKEMKIKQSEYPVLFIAIGNPKESFFVAESCRIDIEQISSIL